MTLGCIVGLVSFNSERDRERERIIARRPSAAGVFVCRLRSRRRLQQGVQGAQGEDPLHLLGATAALGGALRNSLRDAGSKGTRRGTRYTLSARLGLWSLRAGALVALRVRRRTAGAERERLLLHVLTAQQSIAERKCGESSLSPPSRSWLMASVGPGARVRVKGRGGKRNGRNGLRSTRKCGRVVAPHGHAHAINAITRKSRKQRFSARLSSGGENRVPLGAPPRRALGAPPPRWTAPESAAVSCPAGLCRVCAGCEVKPDGIADRARRREKTRDSKRRTAAPRIPPRQGLKH